jgi:quercetin dioxygenase-like cupin family protein
MVRMIDPAMIQGHSLPGHATVVSKPMVGQNPASSSMVVSIGSIAPGGVTEIHKHDFAEHFHFMLKGQVTITTPNGNLIMTEGTGCWTAMGELHGMMNETDKESVYMAFTAPNKW